MVIDKEKLLSLAQKYILRGQSKKAIKEYIKMVEGAPEDKRLHLKLGDLYLKNGENQNAIEEYLKVADLYVEEDLNSRAISIYKRALSIDPNLVEAFHKIAQLYLKEGLGGSARSCYQSILKIKPDDQEAIKALESIEDRKPPKELPKILPPPEPHPPKQHPPAERKTLEAKPPLSPPPPQEAATSFPISPSMSSPISSNETKISLPDKDSEMHYHLGIAYKEMDLFDYAISEFELACTDSSMKFDCCIMLGDCFLQKGDYDKSIEYYKTASEIEGLPNAKLARLYFNLGVAYESTGMISEALSAFNHVLKLDHTFEEAQIRIVKLHEENA